MPPPASSSVCAVAIVKGDAAFIEEWLIYHRLIGIDRFLIYDNDPALPLRALLEPYSDFAEVTDWPGDPTARWPGRNLQTKTYAHALARVIGKCDWITFIDVDEFIVLRRDEHIHAFLSRFGDSGSVRLNWHVFGHNGYYDDPPGLITSSLTRRMAAPSPRTKAISRPETVLSIESAHSCRLKAGFSMADANGRRYLDEPYPGKTADAHVNHYQCRSFLSWMGRVERGDVSFDERNVPPEHAWRLDPNLCLRQFVEVVAKDWNEIVDDYMLRYQGRILDELGKYRWPGHTAALPPHPKAATMLAALNRQTDAELSGAKRFHLLPRSARELLMRWASRRLLRRLLRGQDAR